MSEPREPKVVRLRPGAAKPPTGGGRGVPEQDGDPIGEVLGEAFRGEAPPPDEPAVEQPADDIGPPPFTPLGCDGLSYSIMKHGGQVVELAAKEMAHNAIVGLCGDAGDGWLWKAFPQYDRDGDRVVGWALKAAVRYIIRECSKAGWFDPYEDYRGVGVWRYDPGRPPEPDDPPVIVHCGDVLWTGEVARGRLPRPQWFRPGRWGRHVYGGARPQMRPADAPATAAEVGELLALFGSWHWERREVDPVLLLGSIGAAMVVGALEWRPSIWLAGDKATGKSTLQRLLGWLLGDLPLRLADATEASVRQLLAGAARPVLVDELEATLDNTRAEALIRLAQLASQRDGGKVARGDAGSGRATLFNLDASFLFASTLRPPLPPAMLTRITVLALRELQATPEEREAIRVRVLAAAKLGPGIRRRMIDSWARYERALEAFYRQLAGAGHGSRAADQLGTLLACAWVLAEDGEADDPARLEAWCGQVSPAELQVRDDEMADHDRCALRLLSSREPGWSGGVQRPIAEMVTLALGLSPKNLTFDEGMDLPGMQRKAGRDLARLGLRVYPEKDGLPALLAVSNTCEGIGQIFAGTHWAGRSGATGVWVQALRRVKGAEATENPVRFGEVSTRAVLIPLDSLPLGGE